MFEIVIKEVFVTDVALKFLFVQKISSSRKKSEKSVPCTGEDHDTTIDWHMPRTVKLYVLFRTRYNETKLCITSNGARHS